MATRTTPVRSAWRALAWLLAIVVILGGILTAGVIWWKWTPVPQLGLDLQGGTEIILTPKTEGNQAVTSDQLNQAVAIIRQRIGGLSEAEVSTQGSSNILIELPGNPDKALLQRVESASKMEFRAVLLTGQPSNQSVGASGSPSPSASGSASATPSPSLADTPTAKPTDGSDLNWVTPALQQQFTNVDCSKINAANTNTAPADKPLVTCSDDGTQTFLLGPVEVEGSTISDATAGTIQSSQGVNAGQWAVNIVFNGQGTKNFADVTKRLVKLQQPRNQFAIVLDGKVISAPATQAAITNGKPQITGSFNQKSATELANQLKYGALPVNFTVQSRDTIAATLGATQLQNGLIAGLIGLLLVAVYSLFQYRLLGLVTLASLVVAGVITWEFFDILSWQNGLRLSLAGVAGLIVAIGFTADSFIVYFERIRDELRDGRGLAGAVEAGWKRALRTILAAKSVNLLSAIILYVLAVGNVQGFALTLGITTVIDVVIVVLFTHPVLRLLATTRFFSSGHPLSGLDPTALGAVYRGRAEFRFSEDARRAGASREAGRRQTIAERKAAELEAQKAAGSKAGASKSGAGKGGKR
ncbi:protein translocase subunit SecD [Pseudolysinimonas sp.]|uniref:protein translocase subunit SecD n=1 Tax=Pseudolysinimonas sp. TaxID=2680009 RepID=UPI003F7E034F